MAYLAQDDKQLQDDNGQAQGQTTGAQSGVVSASSGQSGGGSPTIGGQPFASDATGGKGGFGGWTNIQSYLGDTNYKGNSADNLNKVVGGQFDTEKQNLNTQADTTKNQAKTEVDSNNIGQDQASKLIQDAASNYSYDGNKNDTYNNSIGKLNQGVYKQYAGPTDFSYGMDGKTQEYGTNLGSNFQGLMSDVYNNAAGRTLGTGIQNLQRQIDQDNPDLAPVKQALLSKYSGLQSDIDSTVGNTVNALKDYQNQFTTNENNLRGYLNTESGNDRAYVQRAADTENNAIKAFMSDPRFQNHTDEYKPRVADNEYSAQLDVKDNVNNAYSGPYASAENVGGVDNQRNAFNAIMEALGSSDKINKAADTYKIGSNVQTHDLLDNIQKQKAEDLAFNQEGHQKGGVKSSWYDRYLNNQMTGLNGIASSVDSSTKTFSGEDARREYLMKNFPELFQSLYPTVAPPVGKKLGQV